MSIAKKLVTIAENEQKVYDTGYEKGRDIGRQILSGTISEYTDNVIQTVGRATFYGCNKLVSICMPALTTIKADAFAYCLSLKVADLGNVSTIGGGSFMSCRSLRTVILRNKENVCALDGICFQSTYFSSASGNAVVYVPSALLESYQQDPAWSALYCSFLPIEGSQYE